MNCYVMNKIFIYIILIPALTLPLGGCSTLNAGRLSSEQLSTVTRLAREKVLQELELTEAEEETIRVSDPQYSYYLLGGTYAQYFIRWGLPTGMTATVAGDGDILKLDGAEVIKIPTKD